MMNPALLLSHCQEALRIPTASKGVCEFRQEKSPFPKCWKAFVSWCLVRVRVIKVALGER